jgi:hypothetical protein
LSLPISVVFHSWWLATSDICVVVAIYSRRGCGGIARDAQPHQVVEMDERGEVDPDAIVTG